MAATPIFGYTIRSAPAIENPFAITLVVGGGALAVGAGAWVAARHAGRRAGTDAVIAASAYIAAAVLCLAMLSTGTSTLYNAYSAPSSPNRQFDPLLYVVCALVVFGLLFGAGMATAYGRSIVRLAAAFSAMSVLAGVMIFYAALFLAGYNLLTPFIGQAKVPVGLVLGGFLGALIPGRIVESVLRDGRR